VVAVLAAVALGAGPAAAQVAQTPAVAAGSFVSTIYSPAGHNCLDVPNGTQDINANLIGAACTSSPEQLYTFIPETDPNNGLAGYILVNHASGLCAVKFRFEVRQADCVNENPIWSSHIWRLLPVDPATQKYLLEPTYVGATAAGRCMGTGTGTIVPTPFCDPTDATQIMVISGIGTGAA